MDFRTPCSVMHSTIHHILWSKHNQDFSGSSHALQMRIQKLPDKQIGINVKDMMMTQPFSKLLNRSTVHF